MHVQPQIWPLFVNVVGVAGGKVTDEGDEARCAFEMEVNAEVWQPLQHLEDSLFVDFKIVLFQLLYRLHEHFDQFAVF